MDLCDLLCIHKVISLNSDLGPKLTKATDENKLI